MGVKLATLTWAGSLANNKGRESFGVGSWVIGLAWPVFCVLGALETLGVSRFVVILDQLNGVGGATQVSIDYRSRT